MKAAELRQLSAEELVAKRQELRREFFSARVGHSTGQLENTARLGQLRHDLARLETVLHEKQGERE